MANHEGPYRVIRELGRGGMGVVYLAEQISLDRLVALKVLAPDHVKDENLMRRFRQEAHAAKSLEKHELVVQLLDYDLEASPPYIVFEYVEGARPLLELLEHQELVIRQAVSLAYKIAVAVAHIHRNGMIHRDLKPANILITPSGEPKIIDLGLARSVKTEETRVTVDGGTVGTLAYMAPEQIGGEEIDARADVYSLGLIIIELVTGRLVFSGKVAGHIPFHQRLAGQIPPLQRLAPQIRGQYERLATLVQSCISNDPAGRPADCGVVSRSLLAIVDTEPAKRQFGQPHVAGPGPRVARAAGTDDATVKLAAPFAVAGEKPVRERRLVSEPARPRSWRAGVVVAASLLLICGAGMGLWLRASNAVSAVPMLMIGSTMPSASASVVGGREAARLQEVLTRSANTIKITWLSRFAEEHRRILRKVPATVSLALKDHLAKTGILEPLEQFLPVAKDYFEAAAVSVRERWALRSALCDLEILEYFCVEHGVPLPWGSVSIARIFPEWDQPVDITRLDLQHARSWIRFSDVAANRWFPGSSWTESWSVSQLRPGDRLLSWYSLRQWKPGVVLELLFDRRLRRIVRLSPPAVDPGPLRVHAVEYELFGKLEKDVLVSVAEDERFKRAYAGAWLPIHDVAGKPEIRISIIDLPMRGMGLSDPEIIDRVVTLIPGKGDQR